MAAFQVQQASSTVNWTGKKVLGLHTGGILLKNGYIDIHEGIITGGEIEIDMTSITITDIDDQKTHDEFLAHLRNDDFFSVDSFKTAKLIISSAEKIADDTFRIMGALTIKDITHPISFITSVEIFTDFLHSLGEIIVDRTLYNIRYGSGKFIQNLGDKLIYDNFVLQFKLIAQKIN